MTAPAAGSGEARRRVIAIDGPAASGKSTTARAVAARLGFVHLNSGLLYRALTWVALERGWREEDPAFAERVRRLDLRLRPDDGALAVEVEGRRPGEELHDQRVSARVSAISAVPVVRERVLERLRAAARAHDLVCDGRDIGTDVFPDADLKVFLEAEAEERARRRLRDLGDRAPDEERLREETRRLEARDRADSTRRLAPLRAAPDSVRIDTTDRAPEEVVERIVQLCRERGIAAPPGSSPAGSSAAGPPDDPVG